MSNTPAKHLIIYADDDPDDRELVADAFKNYARNIEPVIFEDGVELMRYIRRTGHADAKPCLIILDINMPRLSGKDVLRLLRQKEGFENIPVVLFTTSLPADTYFARHYKAAFVTKPLDTQQINRVIDQFIDHCSEDVKDKIRMVKNDF